jgi:hypothetical protein
MLAAINAVSALTKLIPSWIWALLCAGLLATAGTQSYRLNSLRAQVAEDELARSRALVAQMDRAQEETQRLQGVKDAEAKLSQERRNALEADAGAARRELDGLRQHLAATRAGMPGDTLAAAAARADTRGAVFEACAAEYLSVARSAGGHLEDALEHHRTWPVVRDFDEAVIRAQSLVNKKKESP